MGKPTRTTTEFENLPEPQEVEMKQKFKNVMKFLSGLWTLCLILMIIVPLFDFPGNQLITTFSYLYVFLGLVLLFTFEFFEEKLYSIFVKIYNLMNKESR